jgi:hypothetical protein
LLNGIRQKFQQRFLENHRGELILEDWRVPPTNRRGERASKRSKTAELTRKPRPDVGIMDSRMPKWSDAG